MNNDRINEDLTDPKASGNSTGWCRRLSLSLMHTVTLSISGFVSGSESLYDELNDHLWNFHLCSSWMRLICTLVSTNTTLPLPQGWKRSLHLSIRWYWAHSDGINRHDPSMETKLILEKPVPPTVPMGWLIGFHVHDLKAKPSSFPSCPFYLSAL